jgi:hypothetical protein
VELPSRFAPNIRTGKRNADVDDAPVIPSEVEESRGEIRRLFYRILRLRSG